MTRRQETPDTATIRELAVEAEADPRTVRRVLRGERVRGMVDRRIRRVLERHGVEPLASEPGRDGSREEHAAA